MGGARHTRRCKTRAPLNLASLSIPFQLAWAHPDFGPTLALAATDGSLSIWQAGKGGAPWRRADGPWPIPGGADAARPPPLAWAPPLHGPRLAVGCGDGLARVYVSDALLGDTRAWELESECGDERGAPVTALVWRPTGEEEEGESGSPPSSSSAALPALLAVGTAAGDASVWAYRRSLGLWARAAVLQEGGSGRGSDPITALAWAPRLGRPVLHRPARPLRPVRRAHRALAHHLGRAGRADRRGRCLGVRIRRLRDVARRVARGASRE